jgi:hypothetical protein
MKKIIIILLTFSLFSCDILNTRPPEQPVTAGNSNIPATSPDILFNNFKSSLHDKILENYTQCFVDQSFPQKDFRFIPSPTQYSILNNWDIELEKQNFVNLKSRVGTNGTIVLELLNSTTTTPIGDSATYQSDYNLTISANNQSIDGVYKGSGEFKIFLDKRNPQQWVIVEWRDLANGNSLSWSELKGRLTL